jgi:hypothetical protein
LKEELTDSQPQLLARSSNALPDMYLKAYRWVDETRSIADFIGERFPEADSSIAQQTFTPASRKTLLAKTKNARKSTPFSEDEQVGVRAHPWRQSLKIRQTISAINLPQLWI